MSAKLAIKARLAHEEFTLEVNEEIALAGCVGVFGPSGAGKSSLLRLIAGFEKGEATRIAFNGEIWADAQRFAPAHRRPVGMVFQDGRLFAHLSVEQNLLYADKRSGEGRFTLGDIVDAFDLSPLLAREPKSLSGGERQRVAMARTLLTRPKLLLLDEPLSALDARRKQEIMPYLEGLADRFAIPMLYVSHNVDEITRLASETLIMKEGRIVDRGETTAMINAYGLAPGGEAGAGAVLTGKVDRHDERYALTHVALGGHTIALPMNDKLAVGAPVNIRIDARNVALATSEPSGVSIRNILPARIAAMRKRKASPFSDIELTLEGGLTLRAQLTRAASDDLKLHPGASVFALVKTASFEL